MDKIYTALIVDDEPLARTDLIAVLSGFEEVTVVGEADSIASARNQIEKLDPEIIFLDIQMPGESGFDLLPYAGFNANVIFVTAYDEYAIRAFEVNAVDYLLKPVNKERLALSLKRLSQPGTEPPGPIKALDKEDNIFVKLTNSYQFIRLCNIIKIEAADDYSVVFLNNGESHVVLKPMKEWEMRLPPNTFNRVHRSTIINMDQVVKLEPWFNQAYKVYLKGLHEPVTLSRRFFQDIRRRLG
ncbi:MAG: LytTR family DNA-binding domain-containing protein [Bacteroidota bacterium]